MEPLTHFLTGACIGRAGFNRKTACATVTAVLAAEAADLDVLWRFAGPVEELKHHRGITHTFVGAPVVAAVTVGVVWMAHRWLHRRKPPGSRPPQPIHLGWLSLTALIAALSHILLDWTNNYGVRPFFPFNPRWYAGSFMFIAEPVLWGIFLLALFMPWVLGLADREMGARKTKFRGRGWAVFALVAFALYGAWRWTEHAIGLAMLRETQVAAAPVTRMALEPYPVNPYRWHAILETSGYYQTAEVNTWNTSSPAAIVSDPQADVLYKPAPTPAVEAAKRTLLGRVYLDWGRWAVVRDEGQVPVPALPPPQLPLRRGWSTVTFNDLRFDYSFLRTRSSARAPLSGWVYIVDGRDEAGQGMGNSVQNTPDGAPSE
ncbi:MAG: metal-dependent hydrolase [Acidobacteriota bacterium]